MENEWGPEYPLTASELIGDIEDQLATEHEAYPRDHEYNPQCPLCKAGVPDTFPLWLEDARRRD